MADIHHESSTDALRRFVKTTPATAVLVGGFVLLYIAQRVVLEMYGPEPTMTLFYIRSGHLEYLWTWLAAPLGHLSVAHLVFNSAWGAYLGRWVEQTVGSRRYLVVFLGGGALTAVIGTIVAASTSGRLLVDLGLTAHPPSSPQTADLWGAAGSSMGWFTVLGLMLGLAPTERILVFGAYPRRWLVFSLVFCISLLGTLVDVSVFGPNIGHPYHLVGVTVGAAIGLARTYR